MLHTCYKVVERPRGSGKQGGRAVLVDKFYISQVSSSVHAPKPCELQLPRKERRPADWVTLLEAGDPTAQSTSIAGHQAKLALGVTSYSL